MIIQEAWRDPAGGVAGARTIMIQVVEPLLSLLGVVWGLELIRAFSIFPFRAGWDGRVLGGCFQHIPGVNHMLR